MQQWWARRVHQHECPHQAHRVHVGGSHAPWGGLWPSHLAPRYRPSDEAGRGEAARLVVDGQQRHQVVLHEQPRLDSSEEHERLRPHTTSAAELTTDDYGLAGDFSFIRRPLLLHIYLAMALFKPCGSNIADPGGRDAGPGGGHTKRRGELLWEDLDTGCGHTSHPSLVLRSSATS